LKDDDKSSITTDITDALTDITDALTLEMDVEMDMDMNMMRKEDELFGTENKLKNKESSITTDIITDALTLEMDMEVETNNRANNLRSCVSGVFLFFLISIFLYVYL